MMTKKPKIKDPNIRDQPRSRAPPASIPPVQPRQPPRPIQISEPQVRNYLNLSDPENRPMLRKLRAKTRETRVKYCVDDHDYDKPYNYFRTSRQHQDQTSGCFCLAERGVSC